jgi:hypothetical protein
VEAPRRQAKLVFGATTLRVVGRRRVCVAVHFTDNCRTPGGGVSRRSWAYKTVMDLFIPVDDHLGRVPGRRLHSNRTGVGRGRLRTQSGSSSSPAGTPSVFFNEEVDEKQQSTPFGAARQPVAGLGSTTGKKVTTSI